MASLAPVHKCQEHARNVATTIPSARDEPPRFIQTALLFMVVIVVVIIIVVVVIFIVFVIV